MGSDGTYLLPVQLPEHGRGASYKLREPDHADDGSVRRHAGNDLLSARGCFTVGHRPCVVGLANAGAGAAIADDYGKYCKKENDDCLSHGYPHLNSLWDHCFSGPTPLEIPVYGLLPFQAFRFKPEWNPYKLNTKVSA